MSGQVDEPRASRHVDAPCGHRAGWWVIFTRPCLLKFRAGAAAKPVYINTYSGKRVKVVLRSLHGQCTTLSEIRSLDCSGPHPQAPAPRRPMRVAQPTSGW